MHFFFKFKVCTIARKKNAIYLILQKYFIVGPRDPIMLRSIFQYSCYHIIQTILIGDKYNYIFYYICTLLADSFYFFYVRKCEIRNVPNRKWPNINIFLIFIQLAVETNREYNSKQNITYTHYCRVRRINKTSTFKISNIFCHDRH